MITVVSRWESDQMPSDVERRMWSQLKGFGIDRVVLVPVLDSTIDQFNTMEEALETVKGNKVFLEATGDKGMLDLPSRDEDVVFIFGNTSRNNKEYALKDEMYRINEPMTTNMYPTSAAAVALAYWVGQ